jgi:ATP phosphoribosyltransferase
MIRLALPTGDLREPVGALLSGAGIAVDEYVRGSRSYVASNGDGGLQTRVFREKDIPIQIALANYDFGICRMEWVEDLMQRYPTDAIVPLRDLSIGKRSIYVAASAGSEGDIRDWTRLTGLRLVSEYANIAEALAMGLRLSSYRIFPIWGSAEAYPPEDADLALVAATAEADVRRIGLVPLHRLLESSAWLVANRDSLEAGYGGSFLGYLDASTLSAVPLPRLMVPLSSPVNARRPLPLADRQTIVRMALPDGHQQRHAVAALTAAGLRFDGYSESECVTRPQADRKRLELKVIRPQDMPQQVALGHFDLAICGRDWLFDHLYRFPSSPVYEAADLGLGRYNVAAVVSGDLAADSLEGALDLWRQEGRTTIRVASEYANIADACAREHHLPRYKVIPIGGASEGFVPDDAELLIEGTETGATLAANNLKPVGALLESTACVIARRTPVPEEKSRVFNDVLSRLQRAGSLMQTGEL